MGSEKWEFRFCITFYPLHGWNQHGFCFCTGITDHFRKVGSCTSRTSSLERSKYKNMMDKIFIMPLKFKLCHYRLNQSPLRSMEAFPLTLRGFGSSLTGTGNITYYIENAFQGMVPWQVWTSRFEQPWESHINSNLFHWQLSACLSREGNWCQEMGEIGAGNVCQSND